VKRLTWHEEQVAAAKKTASWSGSIKPNAAFSRCFIAHIYHGAIIRAALNSKTNNEKLLRALSSANYGNNRQHQPPAWDNLKQTLKPGSKLKIAASCFSIYAYEALKQELERIESLEFIFTSPTFVPSEATDKLKQRTSSVPYSQARTRTQLLRQASLKFSSRTNSPSGLSPKSVLTGFVARPAFVLTVAQHQCKNFAGVQTSDEAAIYMPLHGFTAVDLGYQQGDAVSKHHQQI